MNIIANLLNWYAKGTETKGFVTEVFSGDTFAFLDAVTNETCLIKLDKIVSPVESQINFKTARSFAKKILCPEGGTPPLLRVVLIRVEGGINFVDLYFPLPNNDMRQGEQYFQATMISKGLAFLYDENTDDGLYGLQVIAKRSFIGCWAQDKIVYPWNFRKEQKIEKARRIIHKQVN
jgi:hypothetical protein